MKNVLNFGAIGNGLVNDLGAFNKAIAAAGKEGVVYAPAGRYKLSGPLFIGKRQSLTGDKASTILVVAHNGDGVVVKGGGATDPAPCRAGVSDVHFQTAAGSKPSALLVNDGSQNTRFENLLFTDATFGIGIDNRVGYNVQLDSIVFGYCTGTAIRFRHSDKDAPYWSYGPSIRGLDISHHTGDGIVYDFGQGSISNSVIESCTGDAIQLRAASMVGNRASIHLDTVYFEGNTGYAIHDVGHEGTLNARITNGQFFDGVNLPSRVFVGGTFTFDNCVGNPGNTFYGSGVVRLRNCYGMTIGRPTPALTVKVHDRTAAHDGTVVETFQNTLNVNGEFGGGAALILCSHSIGNQGQTNAELFLVRYGFDGNNFTASSVFRDGSEDDRRFDFKVDGEGFLQVTASGTGHAKYLVVAHMSRYGENGY